MQWKIFQLTGLLIFATQSVFCADHLTELISNGLKNGPMLRVQPLRQRMAQIDVDNAHSAFLPTVDLSVAKSFSLQIDEGTGKRFYTPVTGLDLSINIPIWDNGDKLLELENRQLAQSVQQTQAKADTQGYIVRVIDTFLQYQLLINRREALLQRKENALWAQEKAKELVSLGVKTKLDLLDAEIGLHDLSRSLTDLEQRLAFMQKVIDQLVGNKSERPLERIDLLQFEPYYYQTFQQWRPRIDREGSRLLSEQNLSLKLQQKTTQRSALNAQRARKERYPKLSAVGNIRQDFSGPLSATAERKSKDPQLFSSLGLQATWDLWDWYAIERQIEKAEIDYVISSEEEKEAITRKEMELYELIQQFESNEKGIDLSRTLVSKTNEQYAYSKELYTLGRITIYELSQSALTQFEAIRDLGDRLKDRYLTAARLLIELGVNLHPAAFGQP